MYKFQNGCKCPCCGEVLEGKSEEWLVFSNNLSPLDQIVPVPVSGFPPPDSGINPPVNPKM